VLLAAIVAMAASRRRRLDFALPSAVPAPERLGRSRRGKPEPAADFAVPVGPEPTFTSNIRVRRD
jgi:hypothetical protein